MTSAPANSTSGDLRTDPTRRSAERCVSLDSIRIIANEIIHSTFSSAGPPLL
jgi:hypothetical protein